MTHEERVRVSVDERGVAEVAMVRADKMNAIDAKMFEALIAAIDTLSRDARVRVVVVHGEGRAFCAGLDMGRFQEMGEGRRGGTIGDIVTRSHGLANGPQQVGWGWRQLPAGLRTCLRCSSSLWSGRGFNAASARRAWS